MGLPFPSDAALPVPEAACAGMLEDAAGSAGEAEPAAPSLLQAARLQNKATNRKTAKCCFTANRPFPSYRPRLSTQAWISSCETLEEKRCPSSQFPVPAISASSCPLSPRPELADVQKGITVFPVKSFASIKPSTGQAAIPHQMG